MTKPKGHRCRDCRSAMTVVRFTRNRRRVGPGGWEYGVHWRCRFMLCAHECWTRVTKRDWIALGGGK